MRRRRIGKTATKREEKTPATMLSHVTRTPGRMQATSKLKAAVREEDCVETELAETAGREELEARRSAMGATPMRASVYVS